MKMTIGEALQMIARGETPEQYEKRIKRICMLADERDRLNDSIEILKYDPEDAERLAKKQKRLVKVLSELQRLN